VPVRAVIAIIATVIGAGLILSFKPPNPSGPLTAGRLATPPPVTSPAATSSGATSATSNTSTAAPPSPNGNGASSSSSTSMTNGSSLKAGQFTGQDVSMRYGDVQVQITVQGGRITDVQALQLPSDLARSAYISQVAGPLLHDEVLQAQSAQIDTVSGATYTSDAYAQSLQSALDQAHA
jgi:uncharacterized protein with FMN-binding domain